MTPSPVGLMMKPGRGPRRPPANGTTRRRRYQTNVMEIHMKTPISIIDSTGTPLLQEQLEGRFVITDEILRQSGETITIALSLPIRDIAGYFTPDMTGGPRPRLEWTIGFEGGAGRNFPIITFMSQGGENRHTFYADNLVDDFRLTAKMNQQSGCYDLTITFANRMPSRPVSLYLDQAGGDWTAAYERAMATLRPRGKPTFPEEAFAPVYCTWYAVHAALTPEYLDTNARIAAALGCGTFIVDDGWCIDEMKRVNPETLKTWYDYIGDWQVSEKKLPAFRDNVATAQALGLRYLVWIAPFFAYPKSDFYKMLDESERMATTPVLFDPACQRPVRETLRKVGEIIRDLGLDGLKIDFIDALPTAPSRPRGRELYDFVAKLAATIREAAGANALIEFRQRYATPQMLDFATQFRAGDVPFDYLQNLARLSCIRIILGDDVPVHADPLFWREDELDLTVARHMIASLAGVPMISMDLTTLAKGHEAIIRHYLDFYKAHRDTFAHGHWQIRFTGYTPSFLTVTRGNERIIILVDANAMEDAIGSFRGTHHLLNLGTKPIEAKEAYGMAGERLRGESVPCGGRGVLVR